MNRLAQLIVASLEDVGQLAGPGQVLLEGLDVLPAALEFGQIAGPLQDLLSKPPSAFNRSQKSIGRITRAHAFSPLIAVLPKAVEDKKHLAWP